MTKPIRPELTKDLRDRRNRRLVYLRYTHYPVIGNHKYYDLVVKGKPVRVYVLNAAKYDKEQ